jgi:hypothetical protein
MIEASELHLHPSKSSLICISPLPTLLLPIVPISSLQQLPSYRLRPLLRHRNLTTPVTRSFMQIIKKMQTENILSMTISPSAVRDFNEHRELYLKRTAWSGTCSSWFKPGPTASPVMFPGNRVLIIELLTHPRWEDWVYEYGHKGNRFGYMGNGFTMREEDGRGWFISIF